jgi:hypothetical protein
LSFVDELLQRLLQVVENTGIGALNLFVVDDHLGLQFLGLDSLANQGEE